MLHIPNQMHSWINYKGMGKILYHILAET
jgi:hypothetical protein